MPGVNDIFKEEIEFLQMWKRILDFVVITFPVFNSSVE